MLPADPSDIDLEIEEFVVDALERLPQPFAAQLGSVAIVIEDEPSPAQLGIGRGERAVRALPGDPRTRLSADAAPAPSKITLFRGPLVRASRDRAALADRVADTVYHEIAHHFGISDARLHELRDGAQ